MQRKAAGWSVTTDQACPCLSGLTSQKWIGLREAFSVLLELFGSRSPPLPGTKEMSCLIPAITTLEQKHADSVLFVVTVLWSLAGIDNSFTKGLWEFKRLKVWTPSDESRGTIDCVELVYARSFMFRKTRLCMGAVSSFFFRLCEFWNRYEQEVLEPQFVLVLAWGLGHTLKDVQTAEYLAGVLEAGIPPYLLPALISVRRDDGGWPLRALG